MTEPDRTSLLTTKPWLTLPRKSWAELAHASNLTLDQQTLEELRGMQDPTDLQDIEEVYLPLTQLLELYRANAGRLFKESNSFLQVSPARTPFVIGVAGSVAVGKSTVARLLAELLRRTDSAPKVDLITTDGFLYPNAELERRGISGRKGFPESYDRKALLEFVVTVKSGKKATAPVYSHTTYDIVPDQEIVVDHPDIVVIEGLNVLQPAAVKRLGQGLTVSDFFDFSVYVDASEEDIKRWYVDRFLAFRSSAFRDPNSFFRPYAELSDEAALTLADDVWSSVNGPNLRENILPTRDRATAVLRKGPDHMVEWIRIRKI